MVECLSLKTEAFKQTCFLDVGAVLGEAGFWTQTHHVGSIDAENILVAHDEVGHHAVGASVLVVYSVPLLFRVDRMYSRHQTELHHVNASVEYNLLS